MSAGAIVGIMVTDCIATMGGNAVAEHLGGRKMEAMAQELMKEATQGEPEHYAWLLTCIHHIRSDPCCFQTM